MIALGRDDGSLFVHRPDAGMAVPVLVDLATGTHEVRIPAVQALAEDFATFDDMHGVLGRLDGEPRRRAMLAPALSRRYTRMLGPDLSDPALTVGDMRRLLSVKAAGR